MGKRIRTLITGLILPFIALLASAYLFHPLQNYQAASGILPALYWRGMDNALHYVLFSTASLTPVVLSPIIIMAIIYRNSDRYGAIFAPDLDYGPLPEDKTIIYLGVVYGVGSVAIFIAIPILHPDMLMLLNEMLLCLIIILLLLYYMSLYMFFFLWLLIPIIGSTIYVWKGYFRRNPKTWGSESCFFMPCSPQSIKNEDYIYHLLAGALLFAGLEILPPAFRYLRRRYRENRLLFGMSPGRDI